MKLQVHVYDKWIDADMDSFLCRLILRELKMGIKNGSRKVGVSYSGQNMQWRLTET